MENEKPWWSSIAIWSSIVSALAPTIGALTHLTLGVEETNAIAVTIVGIITVVSSIVAIYGRITATEKIETPKLIQKIKG